MPIKFNSDTGTLKGHHFDSDDLDTLPGYFRTYSSEKRKAEAAELNKRYKVIAKCKECDKPLITEEYLAHRMNHVPSRSRALVRTVMAADKETRQEIVKWVKDLMEDKLIDG